MPETQEIVINTGPIIAIVAALGNLSVLQIYQRVWVPLEVCQEIQAGGALQQAVLCSSHWWSSTPRTGCRRAHSP